MKAMSLREYLIIVKYFGFEVEVIMKTGMKWYGKLFFWLCFAYWVFQISRIWIDYSQYEFIWESWF